MTRRTTGWTSGQGPPAVLTFGDQQPDPTLNPGIGVPEHIRALAGHPHGADLVGDLGEEPSPRL